MSPAERIKTVILELQVNNAEELARKIKIDGDLIRNILKERTKKMSGKVAKAISDNFPISYKWLMTDEGEMFLPIKQKKPVETGSDNASPEDKERIIKEKERVIKLLENQIAEQNDRIAEQKEVIKYQKKSIEELTRLDAVRPSRRQTL